MREKVSIKIDFAIFIFNICRKKFLRVSIELPIAEEKSKKM